MRSLSYFFIFAFLVDTSSVFAYKRFSDCEIRPKIRHIQAIGAVQHSNLLYGKRVGKQKVKLLDRSGNVTFFPFYSEETRAAKQKEIKRRLEQLQQRAAKNCFDYEPSNH